MRITSSYSFTPRNNYPHPQNPIFPINPPISSRNQPNNKPYFSSLPFDNQKTTLSDPPPTPKQHPSQQYPSSNLLTNNFLRHTTYAIRPDIMETKKTEYHKLSIGKLFNQNLSENHYQLNPNYKSTNQSFPIYYNNFKKYSYQPSYPLPNKIISSNSMYDSIKSLKQCKTKTYQPTTNYSTISSKTQELKITPTKSTNHIFFDSFRKKNNQNFYTPKIQNTFTLDKTKKISTSDAMLKKTNKKGISIQDFIINSKIGGGRYGTVYQVFHKKTKTIYALKKIPKQILKDQMMISQFILQVKLQTYLIHDNILQIYGVFDDQQNVYLLLQLMIQGTLYKQLKKFKILSETNAAIKLKQIAKAIVYMHQNGIVHRDIKPQNIVISGGVCKLCDFGWATICDDRRKTYCGTFDYAAPQILQGSQYDSTVDLWCLGVLAYQLMVGKAPFYHISKKQTIANILNVQNKKISYPNTMSQKAILFISSLLKKKPQQRLDYQSLLTHPFLKDVNQI